MEEKKSTYRLIILILVIVSLVALFLIAGGDGDKMEQVLEDNLELQKEIENGLKREGINGDSSISGTEDMISVSDQDAGDKVIVSEMSLSESRWVVIHEYLDGDLGNILGARLFFEGDIEGEVELLRGTEAGGKYFAVLYMLAERESDRNRQFDRVRDLPLVKEGSQMEKIFFNTF